MVFQVLCPRCTSQRLRLGTYLQMKCFRSVTFIVRIGICRKRRTLSTNSEVEGEREERRRFPNLRHNGWPGRRVEQCCCGAPREIGDEGAMGQNCPNPGFGQRHTRLRFLWKRKNSTACPAPPSLLSPPLLCFQQNTLPADSDTRTAKPAVHFLRQLVL